MIAVPLSPVLAVIPCGWPLTHGRPDDSGRSTADFKCRAGAGCGVIYQCGHVTADLWSGLAVRQPAVLWRWWSFPRQLVDNIFGSARRFGDGGYSDVMIAQAFAAWRDCGAQLEYLTTNDNALYVGLGFANITGMSIKPFGD